MTALGTDPALLERSTNAELKFAERFGLDLLGSFAGYRELLSDLF
jgi:hypothetical protein